MDASLQGILSLSLGSGPSSVPTKHATGFNSLVSEGKAPAVVCVGGSDDGVVISPQWAYMILLLEGDPTVQEALWGTGLKSEVDC